jgi:Zn-dependent protease/CBS domain-containing protein
MTVKRVGLAAGGLTLGRVWGITIAVHPSWLLVFALVTWSLARGYFPQESPQISGTTAWVLAAATSLAFFASILVHELGHSWVALRHGIPVRSITLFIFGGVAHLGREAASASVELRVALAGPLTSLTLALLFGSAAAFAQGLDILATPLLYLARINAMVALFNLIPGFPLDGGRVFRALTWWWTGSFERATRTASLLGQGLAAVFMVLGLLKIVRGDVLGGTWLALIGWFLQNAAAASRGQAKLTEVLGEVRVSQAMSHDCARVSRGTTLDRVVREEVLGVGRRCFVVVDHDTLAGLLTLHEIKAVAPERWPTVTVADVMMSADRLTTVGPDDHLLAALEKLDDAGVAQMPVVSDGRLLGMLGREEILHYLRTRVELGR